MQAIEHELQSLTIVKGLHDDNDNDDESTGEDDSSWCRHQFAFPTLARSAKKYLAIPSSSAASERVFLAAGNVVTKNRNMFGDYTVDALLVFLDGSHALAWSSGISQEALGRKDKYFFFFVWRRRLGSCGHTQFYVELVCGGTHTYSNIMSSWYHDNEMVYVILKLAWVSQHTREETKYNTKVSLANKPSNTADPNICPP